VDSIFHVKAEKHGIDGPVAKVVIGIKTNNYLVACLYPEQNLSMQVFTKSLTRISVIFLM
jgi:hypothetical protein